MSCGIYKLEVRRAGILGGLYVGASQNIERRFSRHFSLLEAGDHHCWKLQRAWWRAGSDALLVLGVLQTCEAWALQALEQIYLQRARRECSDLLLNATEIPYPSPFELGITRDATKIIRALTRGAILKGAGRLKKHFEISPPKQKSKTPAEVPERFSFLSAPDGRPDMARYVEIDAEAVIRAASAREDEIGLDFDPEVLECLEMDASKRCRRDVSAHANEHPLNAKPRPLRDRPRRVA